MHANSFSYQTQQQACGWDIPMASFHRHLHVREGSNGYEDKEPMFEKPLTPSDVGKLNRLVIPKQYAEKYFPLDADAGEKGLLLSFEDETGKPWKFRYSYWTSSQSYVLTKGWSRFVKEKQLDAGDSVLFLRLCSNADRLYIGCRRRGSAPDSISLPPSVMQWNPAFPSSSCMYLNTMPHVEQRSSEAAPQGTGNSKRLRLFGVNLECGHLLPNSSLADSSGNRV